MGRAVSRWKPLFTRSGWCALVVLFGAAHAATPNSTAWDTACALAGYSCTNIPPPLVFHGPLGVLDGHYKMGNAYVQVNFYVAGNIAYAVTVHEMVHYLQWQHRAWTFKHENRCKMEREAFVVSNLVLRRLGETRQVPWDSVKAYYGCRA